MIKLNEQVRCYLTKDAEAGLRTLTEAGIDEDLALAVLEKLWPEQAVYELPSTEEVVSND